ncbi:MAG TPA: hypothetical protein VFK14_11560 [Solirubrobacterales bacterium]|nr:hypothetical protein [Solirubrobacterales bacterium]
MTIRSITKTADLKPWLPSDYSATGWDDTQIQAALDAGHHPRLIAAEIWDDFALTVDDAAETSGEKVVESWKNVDLQVAYKEHMSPREYAQAVARFHRARGPVKGVQLSSPTPQAGSTKGLPEPYVWEADRRDPGRIK